ncbi:cysteine protease [Plakobranchus ocellatus]|uniref:Cysteine protease n=1 Tax=Plakobranchus ocellatus TaxID=259542 RepID=A0AAV3ZPV2_9GAST|nr:cysteine protease [Plakobranchus ocellatus]
MKASAAPLKGSPNSFNSYEESLSSPRSSSGSRAITRQRLSDGILSVKSWSEVSDTIKDDLDSDPLTTYSNSHQRSISFRENSPRNTKEGRNGSDHKYLHHRSMGNNGKIRTASGSVFDEDDACEPCVPHHAYALQSGRRTSVLHREQSISGRPLYEPTNLSQHANSDFNYETDLVDQSQPDFSYFGPQLSKNFSSNGRPSDDPIRTCCSREFHKDKSSNKKHPHLYPVLGNLEQLYDDEIGAQSRASAIDTYAEDFSDGPVSMPDMTDSSDIERTTPFQSLPSSTPSHLQPSTLKKPTGISGLFQNQSKIQNGTESRQERTWSIWPLHQSQPIISKVTTLKRQPKSSSDLEALRDSFEHRLEHDNVKTKVMSAWNNFKYGWMFNTKPNIKHDSPLFMLGRCYHMRKGDVDDEPVNEFLKDFTSRIWMTYRSNFYPIPGTKLNTDCGWGCMLRSAQMLIIQCLVTHYLGRAWRLHNPQTETEHAYYREIIRWFSDPVDAPSDKTPFSLHHLVSFGRHYNKEPGEWFGPSSAAFIFRDAFALASRTLPILSQLCVYVAQDCTVYLDDVKKLCTARDLCENLLNSNEEEDKSKNDNGDIWLRSLILLIPMRLGGEVMNEIYVPCVKNLLAQENCMGIIGGKPKHSLYFLGWQDNKLIHLDPHFCREAVDTSDKNFKIETYHCMSPRKLSITKMDPSCTVGFYIRNASQFQKFVEEVREFVCPENQRGAYPLFIFSEGSHSDNSVHQVHTGADRGRVKITHFQIDKNGQRLRTYSKDSEDFVIL